MVSEARFIREVYGTSDTVIRMRMYALALDHPIHRSNLNAIHTLETITRHLQSQLNSRWLEVAVVSRRDQEPNLRN